MGRHDRNQVLVKELAQNTLKNTHSIHILSVDIELNFGNLRLLYFPCESCRGNLTASHARGPGLWIGTASAEYAHFLVQELTPSASLVPCQYRVG